MQKNIRKLSTFSFRSILRKCRYMIDQFVMKIEIYLIFKTLIFMLIPKIQEYKKKEGNTNSKPITVVIYSKE